MQSQYEPIPTNENHQLVSNIGYFIILCGVLDNIINTSIMKMLRLSPDEGAILTSSLGAKEKLEILSSLYHLKYSQKHDAITTLEKIKEFSKRNQIIHGICFIGNSSIELIKLSTSKKLKSSSTKFNVKDLMNHINELCNMINSAQIALELSQSDLQLIPNIAKKLAKGD